MMIKFLTHGTGDAREASKYVLETSKSFSKETLSGCPELFNSVANSLDFKYRYSSAVISWSLEDQPTPEQIHETLDRFYDVAFAGLDRDRFSPLAVLHTGEDGRKDLHVLIPRVDLETGLSYNSAPPNWQKLYDPMRDMVNYKFGWSRPDDEQRKRVVNLGKPESIDRKNGKEQITTWLTERINAGLINGRDDIVNSLAEIGTITRQGKDYVSVQLPDFEKPLRLKGGIYEQQFDVISIREAEGKNQRRCGVDEQEQLKRYLISQREFTKVIERVSGFNAKKYARPESTIDKRTSEPEQNINPPTLAPDLHNDRISANHARGNVGANSVPSKQDSEQLRSDRSERARDTEANEEVLRSISPDQSSRATEEVRELKEDDTARNPVNAFIATAHRLATATKRLASKAVGWFDEHFERRAKTTRNLATASADINTASEQIDATIEQFRQEIKEQYLERKSIAQQVKQIELEQRITRRSSPSMDM